MSAVKGVNKTIADNPTPSTIIAAGLWGGRVKVMTDTYEAAALAAGSTIAIAKLPVGAKVIDVIVSRDALGAGVTLSVGDSTSAARYLTGSDESLAGTQRGINVDGMLYQITSTTQEVLITLGAGGAATGTIKSAVLYVED